VNANTELEPRKIKVNIASCLVIKKKNYFVFFFFLLLQFTSIPKFFSKYLFCSRLAAYRSVNMADSETFYSSPLSATAQNSMDRQSMAQEHHGSGGFSSSKLYLLSVFSLVFHCTGQSAYNRTSLL
jgi:hypothetical protein